MEKPRKANHLDVTVYYMTNDIGITDFRISHKDHRFAPVVMWIDHIPENKREETANQIAKAMNALMGSIPKT